MHLCARDWTVPRIVPTQSQACVLNRGPRVVFLRVDVAFRDGQVAVPGQVASAQGSMNGAQRVRQVWRNVYVMLGSDTSDRTSFQSEPSRRDRSPVHLPAIDLISFSPSCFSNRLDGHSQVEWLRIRS